jgi:hypothetical protein
MWAEASLERSQIQPSIHAIIEGGNGSVVAMIIGLLEIRYGELITEEVLGMSGC